MVLVKTYNGLLNRNELIDSSVLGGGTGQQVGGVFVLKSDSDNSYWNVGVTNGQLWTDKITDGSTPPVTKIEIPDTNGIDIWALGITAEGILTTSKTGLSNPWIGTVTQFLKIPPAPWLLLSGQSVPTNSYPKLATFYPDLVVGDNLQLPDLNEGNTSRYWAVYGG